VLKLGLLTTTRLDLQRLVFGSPQNDFVEEESIEVVHVQSVIPEEVAPEETFNTMNIDFDTLISNEKNEVKLDMHKYFAATKPTNQNEYTGVFKGDNLILITAEAFSPYAISPELTPTLYKMSTQGFVFKNFYNPIWGVSTSDGEYVACTGLIPKTGIWSFYRSGRNDMPFALGNQFKKLGYKAKAYHNHTYTYYKREISHPNMGYDFKAVGNGLEISKTWPESDLEMIEATAEEYIGQQPFHTYYMTVSGHMMYNFDGNYMAKKNKAFTEHLTYSDEAKAYIACNLELEFAMKALIDKLEAAGIADKTVIAISPDHYPYGLSRAAIDELAGHKLEGNFELYKSTFILWKKGMEPIIVEEPCSSLDINPTISNLFGLAYDSRLMMGGDILSDKSPLVIFSNNSWITDVAKYNSLTNTAISIEGSSADVDYVNEMNKIVAKKVRYSAKILETDYYNCVIQK
jgi:phosphoglycerol transferase MdoB-like AlkP superfamily enzyme